MYKKSISYIFFANVIYAGLQWIQISMISKLSSLEILGYYTLSLALTAPVLMLLNFQLRSQILTDNLKSFNYNEYLTFRFITNIISLLIIFIMSIFYEIDTYILIGIGINKIIESFAEYFNSILLKIGKTKTLASLLISKGIIITFSLFIGLYFYKSIYIGLMLSNIFFLIFVYFFDYRIYKKYASVDFRWQSSNFIAILKLLFPLGVVLMIISLNTNTSKYILDFYLGVKEQGIYSTLAYFLVIGNFINSAIGQVITPRISTYFSENKLILFKNAMKKYILFNLVFSSVIFIIFYFSGDFLIKLFFISDFQHYKTLLDLIMFSGIFIYISSALGYCLTAMRLFNIQPLINGGVLIINIIISFYFIKLFGLYGAVYSSILSFIFQITFQIIIIYKNVKYKSITYTS